jgi:hypothetical protein
VISIQVLHQFVEIQQIHRKFIFHKRYEFHQNLIYKSDLKLSFSIGSMSEGEFELDSTWKSDDVDKEKQELIFENIMLHREISTLRLAISNLFERLSIVSGEWFPRFKYEVPHYDNLSAESHHGTFNSVVTLCQSDPAVLKKFSQKHSHFFFSDFRLFTVRQERTWLTS